LNAPIVSVIVPNYNHARFLRQRINTILAQSFLDFELLLLDDCSTDESRAILREYVSDLRVRLDFNESNSGSTFKQWNKGVRLARGKYVWLAESDDYSDPRFLERLVALLDADPEVMIAYCRSWRVRDDDASDARDATGSDGGRGNAKPHEFAYPLLDAPDLPRWSTDFCADGTEECRRYFVIANLVRNASSAVFRKAAYEEAGGADESLRLCGDWKLWASIALRGKMAYVSDPLNYYRLHAGSVWGHNRDGVLETAEVLRVIRWIMDHVTPTDAARKRTCERLSQGWVMALMSSHVSLEKKKAILRDVRAIDSHPLRHVFRPAITTVRMKINRLWRDLHSPAARTPQPPRIAP
jgi:glycosyltransferase involved in cell wall biosynthesis